MGGDGGSITTRADMVKTKGYRFLRNLGGMGYVPNTQVREGDERFSRSEARDLQLSTCSLSQEPLRLPIVACRLGRLYNKEELLSRLLNKSMPPHMQHIASLKDVQQCVTEINQETHFLVCPVSRVDIRSGVKASIVWPCGCIISDKARRAAATAAAKDGVASSSSPASQQDTRDHSEDTNQNAISSSSSPPSADSGCSDARPACVHCGQRYDPEEDLIPLLPEEEELEKLQDKLRKLLEAKRAAKQAKKSRTATNTSNDAASSSSNSSCSGTTTANNRRNDSNGSSSVNSSSSSSINISSSGSSKSSSSSASKRSSSSPGHLSTSGDHKGSSVHNGKSEVRHPAVVAPCATSTRLQAESFKWLQEEKEDEEKQHKRKQRDWVLSNSSAVEEIVGTTKAPRTLKRGNEHGSELV